MTHPDFKSLLKQSVEGPAAKAMKAADELKTLCTELDEAVRSNTDGLLSVELSKNRDDIRGVFYSMYTLYSEWGNEARPERRWIVDILVPSYGYPLQCGQLEEQNYYDNSDPKFTLAQNYASLSNTEAVINWFRFLLSSQSSPIVQYTLLISRRRQEKPAPPPAPPPAEGESDQ